MKRILIGIIVLTVGGMGVYIYMSELFKPTPYTAPEFITKEVTKEVDPLEVSIQEAINASSTQIKQSAQEAYDATVERMEKEIELEVRKKAQLESEQRIKALEEEVSF